MSTAAEAKEAVESLDEVLLIDRLLTVVVARLSKPDEPPPAADKKKRKSIYSSGASESAKPKPRPFGAAQKAAKSGSGFRPAGTKGRPSEVAPEKTGRSGRPGKGRK